MKKKRILGKILVITTRVTLTLKKRLILGAILTIMFLAIVQPAACPFDRKRAVDNQQSIPKTFRLLALESWASTGTLDIKMKDGQYLIEALIGYDNWRNGTGFTSYIELLTLYNQSELFEDCKRFYVGNATKNNLRNEITTFLASAGKDEVVVFYYSGHGSTQGLGLDQHIDTDELASWLNTSGLSETTMCVILETCNAGIWNNDGQEPGGILGQGRLVMAACESNQLAYGTLEDYGSWFTGPNELNIGPIGIIGSLKHANYTNGDDWLSMQKSFEFARVSTEQWATRRGLQQNPKVYNGLSDKYDPPLILRTPSQPPSANFSYSPSVPWVNETVTFNSTDNYDSYTWNFGDGNITTSGPVINHTYTNTGNFTVTLNVTDNDLSNTTTRVVTITFVTDLNRDKTVNILDIATVASAYGSTPGTPKWNDTADLDKNRAINIIDVTLVAKDYSKSI